MSKSPTFSKTRRCAVALAGLLTTLAAVCAAAPDAFALHLMSMQVPPPDETGTAATATVAGHSGTPGWEIALIVIGAVMLISVLVAVVLHRRAPARLQRAVS
jgi:hypothetical protein